ncbi:class I SAM-dependent methyltransferase [Nocardia yamanashiensis]|uniref:class I SAM-dependent methyltransferase n=1 Tax=Nocardia yamanashiensis TaxID=209247 RepID=UPI000831E3FC|nr:class I SAM-dependent methyltransferase [Nocardia yamanashiensis]
MLDYDAEAANYDRTRGGEERAEAAAAAVRTLLPRNTRTVVDVACGTGIVSARLHAPNRTVLGVDLSAGMLAYARPRLRGAAVRADATRLPLADSTIDAVIFMWLLHLVDAETADRAVAEAARVLRPGGVVVATVDKNLAMYAVPSDLSAVLEPAQRAALPENTDAWAAFTASGHRNGLDSDGETSYVGHGQGWSPRQLLRKIPQFDWYRGLDNAAAEDLSARVAALPEPDRARPDPVYRIARLRKAG